MNTTRTGSKELIRDLNRSLVLNLIATHGPISRVEVARRGRLTAATITNIVNEFVDAELVLESASEEFNTGRPPILLQINPGAGYVIGVKLREYKVVMVLCDLSSKVLYHTEHDLPLTVQPYQVVEAITTVFEKCLQETGINHQDVLGMGVGVSGLVDSAHGTIHYSNFFDWENVELGPALEFKTRVPVIIENDVNMLALAESHFGHGRTSPICLLVTVGHGVGMGLVIHGELFRGIYGGASEFGHMTIDFTPEAPPCTCGKRGCLEAIVSDYAIAHAALGVELGYSDEAMMQKLAQRAREGDETIYALFARASTTLGIALANLINLFDPMQVLITGEALRASDLLLEPARPIIARHLFGKARPEVPLITFPSSNESWARGAACVFLREVFRPPIYETGKTLPIDTLLSRTKSRGIRGRAK